MTKRIDVLKQIRDRVLTKIPRDQLPEVEIEVKRIEDEASIVNDVLDCGDCALITNCTNKVPGIGPVNADIMFVGEAPGAAEDEQGLPFVGPGGQLLDRAIQAIGWSRDEIYMTNVTKCRTPNNRIPTAQEITSCYKHLKKEIEVVKPRVIVCCGSTAANVLIHPDFKIMQEHGHWFEKDNMRMIAVYNPSFLLRLGEGSDKQNQAKWEVFKDLEKVKIYQASGFQPDRF